MTIAEFMDELHRHIDIEGVADWDVRNVYAAFHAESTRLKYVEFKIAPHNSRYGLGAKTLIIHLTKEDPYQHYIDALVSKVTQLENQLDAVRRALREKNK